MGEFNSTSGTERLNGNQVAKFLKQGFQNVILCIFFPTGANLSAVGRQTGAARRWTADHPHHQCTNG